MNLRSNTVSQGILANLLARIKKNQRFEKVEFTKLHFDGGVISFNKARFTNVNFININTEGKGPSIYIKCAEFKKAKFMNVTAKNASLLYVDFSDATLDHVDLESTYMFKGKFINARLSQCNLNNTDLRHANFSNAQIQYSSLRTANLLKANLTNASCLGCDFKNAHLYGANLQGANLTDALLEGTNLRNANLKNANLEFAHFFPIDVSELDAAKLYGILNRYERLYCSHDYIDPNLKLLKKHICSNLISKLHTVHSQYGTEEAIKLFDIAIEHPFFATNRSNFEIDKSKLTTSQKNLIKEKARSQPGIMLFLGPQQPRHYRFDYEYLDTLSQLNSQQLTELLNSHRAQIKSELANLEPSVLNAEYQPVQLSNLLQQYEKNTTASRLMFALLADAKDIDQIQLSQDLQAYVRRFGDKVKDRALYKSLQARLLSLQEDKGRLIGQLCTTSPALGARTRINPPSHPAAYYNLRGTDLSNLHLQKSDLRDSNLSGSILIRTDLSLATLTGANLENAVFFPSEDLSVATATELLDFYAHLYINNQNFKYLKPAIMRDLIKKVHGSALSDEEKSTFLNSIMTHRLFAEHQNKMTRKLNNCLSFFKGKQVIYTNTQKEIKASIQAVSAPAV